MATNFAAVTNSAGIDIGTIKSSSKSVLAGWIGCDDKTIGKEGSGADFTGDLYRKLYDELWNLDGLSTTAGHPFRISSAKGGSEQADWDALKTIRVDFATNQVFMRQKTSGRNLGSFEDEGASVSKLNISNATVASDGHTHGAGSLNARVAMQQGQGFIDKVASGTFTAETLLGDPGVNTLNGSFTSKTPAVISGTSATDSGSTNVGITSSISETRPFNVAVNFFIKY